jgi:hypothetical protein
LVESVDAVITWIADPKVIAVIATIAAVAAIAAVLIGWRQLRSQAARWRQEDERVSPKVQLKMSGDPSDEGWFHAVWAVDNRATSEVVLVRLEARKPRGLMLGMLDPNTDGQTAGMRVLSSARKYALNEVVPPKVNGRGGHAGKNILYRISKTPEQDRGRRVLVRFVLAEVENPSHVWLREVEATIPT